MSASAYLAGIDAEAELSERRRDPIDELLTSTLPSEPDIEPEESWDRENWDDDGALDRAAAAAADVARSGALAPFSDRESAPAAAVSIPARPARILKSEIPSITDEAWTRFAVAMRTAQPGAVSGSNGLGAFELKPRRLADLGLMKELTHVRSPNGRMIWVGEFVRPMTQKKFLADMKAQYRVFSDSMKRYVAGLRNGSIEKPEGGPEEGMSLSGVLAILHRAGPLGLKGWNDESKRFAETVDLYERANGIF